jgi:hypothetical protein
VSEPTTPTGKRPAMTERQRLVFGQADPKDYWQPLCGCGHMRSEHYNGQGGYDPPTPCWHGWTDKEEGCECDDWYGPEPAWPES